MNIHARLAIASDVEAIVNLWQRFVQEETAVIATSATATVQDWQERLRQRIDQSKVFVVVGDRQLVGFLALIDRENSRKIPPDVAYVVDFYVVPEARRSNAALNLYRTAKEAIAKRYQQIWTNTHRKNHRMQTLLDYCGFEVMSDFALSSQADQLYFKRKL